MSKLLEFFLQNLKENPEVKPAEKLNRVELKTFLLQTAIIKDRENQLNQMGLDKLLIGQFIYQFLDLPKASKQSWQSLCISQHPLGIEFAFCLWVQKVETLLEGGEFLTEEIIRFEAWLKTVNDKFPKIETALIDTHVLKNIWVDYKLAKLVLNHIKTAPPIVISGFEENLVDFSILLHNTSEFYNKEMEHFKEGKATVYGKHNERANYRIPLSQLKEIQQIIENIKSINIRYLNKGLEMEHFLALQKEISKLNISMVEEVALRQIREARILESGVSEKLLFDVLNDFLVALGFKQAISEEDEMNHLKKEGVTMDTIRQMKKRLILGISK